MMKTMKSMLLLLLAVDVCSAWSNIGRYSLRIASAQCRLSPPTITRMAASNLNNGPHDNNLIDLDAPGTVMHEFDYLLRETNDPRVIAKAQGHSGARQLKVNLGGDTNKVLMASAVAAESATTEESQVGEDINEDADADTYDPYGDIVEYNQQRIQTLQQAPPTLESRLKQMDFQDVVVTLVVPSIVSFVGLRWGFNKVTSRISDKANTLLDQFAKEMVYHDGKLEELRLCHADYSRQLMWMGPRKGDAMIKRFLQVYAKKKTVSPQAIGTISYIFTLFKLSEEKAASTLVSLCEEMGPDKISTAGKVLFFGSRILKTPEGLKGLEPIKDMIKGTYRDATVAETLVESSQQAMAEAAYRSTVLAAGKNQKSLTAGWQTLGLDKATATRIFEEASKEGFVSERVAMYGMQTQKYDKKGNRIDDEGKPVDPKAATGEDDKDDTPTSNVYTCEKCGYTLFIAKGREFKFYGDDFKCPECGAKKDQFKPANIEED